MVEHCTMLVNDVFEHWLPTAGCGGLLPKFHLLTTDTRPLRPRYFMSQQMSVFCTPCDAGKSSEVASIACSECPAGTKSSTASPTCTVRRRVTSHHTNSIFT